MKPLGLTFRLDDVVEGGRDFNASLSAETVKDCVSGLLGDLGYRAYESASVVGKVYRTANDEVIVDSRLKTSLQYRCVRCLNDCTLSVDVRQDHVLVRSDSKPKVEEIELTDADLEDDAETFMGDEIELEPIFRQDLILSLPMNPTCDDGQGETCQYESYQAQADDSAMDPRWAALADLKKKLKPQNEADE